MNVTTRAVLRHFLLKLCTERDNPKVAHIDPFFQKFFTRSELQDIVCSIFKDKDLEEYALNSMSKEELLNVIGDDALILGYFLDYWEDETLKQTAISCESIIDTLNQLGLHTHYLGSKEMGKWDSYDHANYQALQLKAGKICRVYGLYDVSVNQKDLAYVTSPPLRYYESYPLAEAALGELIKSKRFQPQELHILSLFTSRY